MSVAIVLGWAARSVSRRILSRRLSRPEYDISRPGKLVFVVRLYKEQRRARALVEKWSQFAGADRTDVVFACVSGDGDAGGLSTAESLRRELAKLEHDAQGSVFEFEGDASVARQTNAAARWLAGHHDDPANVWIKTVDSDNTYPGALIAEILSLVEQNYPVIEVPGDFLQNFERLPLLQRWHAIHQDRWSRVFEQYRGLLKNRFPRVYSSVSGAGCAIRLDVLLHMGGFPEAPTAEDLALTWTLNARGIPIQTTKHRLPCDTPSTLRAGLHQEYEWSVGALDAVEYGVRQVRLMPRGESRTAAGFSVAAAAWSCFVWGIYTPVALGSFVGALRRRSLAWGLPAILLSAALTLDGILAMRRARAGTLSSVRLLATLPLQLVRVSIPFWVALFRRLTKKRKFGRRAVYRTEY